MADGRFKQILDKVASVLRSSTEDSTPRPTPTMSQPSSGSGTKRKGRAKALPGGGRQQSGGQATSNRPASTPAAQDHEHDGIRIEYAPVRDGDADPGEVVWTWVAYEDDPSQGKDRPVLVLGWEGALLIGVQLSSKDHGGRRDAQDWVAVGTGAWDSQGRPSFADAARLLRVEPSAVRREGSALDRGRFEAVLQRVEIIHEWRH